jgi:ABC-2 type transport system ATP-binding protein
VTPTLSTAPDPAIDLHEVAKTYRGRFGRGGVRALRGISMRVERGEIFGLLGPNGAGKSTLVKILMTVIRPTRCRGTMLGRPVGQKAALARVGYLPEHHRFADYLTGAQVIDFYGAMNGVDRRTRRARTGALLELVGMSAWAAKRVRSYSKGMRQRIGIAQALVNDPELVLLDEPTDGVDPVGRRDIRAICQRMKDEGRTVFINSHLLSELEMVCDRVAILVKGIVAQQGTLDELTVNQQQYIIELAMPEPQASPELIRGLLPQSLLGPGTPEGGWSGVGAAPKGAAGPAGGGPVPYRGQLASGHTLEIDHSTIRVGTSDAPAIQPLIDALRGRGVVIRAIRPHRPSLEDLFMQAVTDPATGQVLAPGAETPAGRGRRGEARVQEARP